MFCPRCGTESLDDSQFCRKCGNAVAAPISGVASAAATAPGPIVPAYGPVRSDLYVLGERAGADECREGVPFVGRAGQTLREWFHCAGLDLDNFRRWNVCIDYQKGNPHPKPLEIERDRAEVEADIARCEPGVIAAVGVHATNWCFGRRVKLGTVHGRAEEVQIGGHKAFCVPIFHPSTYGRIERAKKGKDDVLALARVLQGLTA